MATAEDSRAFMLQYYLILYGILYYDFFATLHKEYRRIWLAQWSVVKTMYLVNRYLMLVESVFILVGFTLNWSANKCQKNFIPLQAVLPVIISAAGGIVLVIRTHAIWSHAKWVLYVLTPLLLAQIGTSTWLAITQVGALAFPDDVGPCIVAAKSGIMDAYCVLPMVFDLTTSCLCLYKGLSLKRELGSFPSRLLRNFTRHGIFYAVGAAAANAANLALMAIMTRHLKLPVVPSNGGMLCTVFSSIFISRLILGLKSDDPEPRSSVVPGLPVTVSSFGSHRAGRASEASFTTYVNPPSIISKRHFRNDSDDTAVETVPLTPLPRTSLSSNPTPDSTKPFVQSWREAQKAARAYVV